MDLMDNNQPIDDDVREVLEEMLDEFLTHVSHKEGFWLSELYRELGVKYADTRSGSLDLLIAQTLENWNWRHRCIGWKKDIVLYERRRYPGKPKHIHTANGSSVTSGESWPPYAKRRNRDPQEMDDFLERFRSFRRKHQIPQLQSNDRAELT